MQQIIYEHTLSVGDYNALRESVGWAKIEEKRARTGIENSAYLVAAKEGGKAVGTARVVSDGGYVYYIADVMVRPEFQGRGIGKTMMEMIMEYIRGGVGEGEHVMACLMAAKGRESFYRQFGFASRPNEDFGAGMSQHIDG